MYSVEITIPVLNEEKTIETQVAKICGYIDNELIPHYDVAVIVVDNGSTDSTPSIAKKLTSEFKCVQYFRLEERGVGRALKAAWRNSSADIIGYMDLDLSTDIRHVKEVLDKLINSDVSLVTGTRLLEDSKVTGRGVLRTFTSRSFNYILKIVFGTSFSDGMCGFKFMKAQVFNDIYMAGAKSNGWFFATQVLVLGEFLGYKVRDHPIRWVDDPDSKVKVLPLAMEYFGEIFKLKRNLFRMRKVCR